MTTLTDNFEYRSTRKLSKCYEESKFAPQLSCLPQSRGEHKFEAIGKGLSQESYIWSKGKICFLFK